MHSRLKTYPDGGEKLRDTLYEQRDRYSLSSRGQRIIGIDLFLATGKPLGKIENYTRVDRIHYGTREPVSDKVLRNGELLNKSFPSNPYTSLESLVERGGRND